MNVVRKVMFGLCAMILLPPGANARPYDAYMGEHIFAGYPDNTRSKSEFTILENKG